MDNVVDKKICGIVMPISGNNECNDSHWREVLEIIKLSVNAADFIGNLVSNSDDVGIIQKRIIQNLYDNPIVVCDVSCKNPNVMFELGIRLAFDKPTVIIKDDKTSYSFDTAQIEHVEYPRDLRYSKIEEFKIKLTEKIKATYIASVEDANHSTFLKHFGEFKIAKLDKKEVSTDEFLIGELKALRDDVSQLFRIQNNSNLYSKNKLWHEYDANASLIDKNQFRKITYYAGTASEEEIDKAFNVLRSDIQLSSSIDSMNYITNINNEKAILIDLKSWNPMTEESINNTLNAFIPMEKRIRRNKN